MDSAPPVALSLVIPVYNEKDAVAETLVRACSVIEQSGISAEIIVVDDGSDDGTGDVLKNFGSSVQIVRHPVNRGYGAAIKTGLRHAQGEWIAITDADGTYPLEKLPELWSLTQDAEMVVGTRPRSAQPMIRRPAKWFLARLSEYVARTRIPDMNSGFRLIRADLLKRYLHMLPDGFSLTTTITLALHSDGFRVQYAPIQYHKRQGRSKIHPVRDPWNFTILILRICLFFNPLRVFAPLFLFFFGLGTGVLVYSKVYTPQVMDVTVTVLYFVSIQMLVLGMLGDVIVRRNRG